MKKNLGEPSGSPNIYKGFMKKILRSLFLNFNNLLSKGLFGIHVYEYIRGGW